MTGGLIGISQEIVDWLRVRVVIGWYKRVNTD
jgi:hypothetical protein